MDISEIRVKLVGNPKERLKAVCSVTFNGEFVVRDLKVIEGTSGLFVAMPSRKLADHCPKCRSKNHLRARFCNDCGQKLDEKRADRIRGGRARLHADIAHPINSDCRNHLQAQVVQAFQEELERSKQPGYQPAAYDELEVETGHEYDELIADLKKDAHGRRGARTRSDEPVDAEPAELPEAPDADDVPAARPASAAPPRPAAPPAKDDDFSAGIV
jgi:stage V sporulation protein G